MSYDLKNKLVVAISSRALFDLEKENKVFEKKGVKKYYKYLGKKEAKPLKAGTGYRLVENLLKINSFFDKNNKKVEVLVLSKNNAATSLRITNEIKRRRLDITRSGWTSGGDIARYLKAFKVDLFLSADTADVKNAIKGNIAAAKILSMPRLHEKTSNQVRIAFDGDAVLFNKESELIYKAKGVEEFVKHENKNKNNPMKDGPFANLLRNIGALQNQLKDKKLPPIRTALVTARNAPAHERVIITLNSWGVRIDESFFLGGGSKHKLLEAFGADIFFDDQDLHLKKSSKKVPSAKVLT